MRFDKWTVKLQNIELPLSLNGSVFETWPFVKLGYQRARTCDCEVLNLRHKLLSGCTRGPIQLPYADPVGICICPIRYLYFSGALDQPLSSRSSAQDLFELKRLLPYLTHFLLLAGICKIVLFSCSWFFLISSFYLIPPYSNQSNEFPFSIPPFVSF